jgi:hypothetical protein
MPLASVAGRMLQVVSDPADTQDPNEDENARPPRRLRQVVRDEDYSAAAERWLAEENP